MDRSGFIGNIRVWGDRNGGGASGLGIDTSSLSDTIIVFGAGHRQHGGKVVPQPPRHQRANLSSLSGGRCLSVGSGLSARTARRVTRRTFNLRGDIVEAQVVFCAYCCYYVFSATNCGFIVTHHPDTCAACLSGAPLQRSRGLLHQVFPLSYFHGTSTDHTDVIGNASPRVYCKAVILEPWPVVARVFVFACRQTWRHSLVSSSSSTGSGEPLTARAALQLWL